MSDLEAGVILGGIVAILFLAWFLFGPKKAKEAEVGDGQGVADYCDIGRILVRSNILNNHRYVGVHCLVRPRRQSLLGPAPEGSGSTVINTEPRS